jgi:hypothetical protein
MLCCVAHNVIGLRVGVSIVCLCSAVTGLPSIFSKAAEVVADRLDNASEKQYLDSSDEA